MNKKYRIVTSGNIYYSDSCDLEEHCPKYDMGYCDIYLNYNDIPHTINLIASARYFDYGNGKYMIMKGYMRNERDSKV